MIKSCDIIIYAIAIIACVVGYTILGTYIKTPFSIIMLGNIVIVIIGIMTIFFRRV